MSAVSNALRAPLSMSGGFGLMKPLALTTLALLTLSSIPTAEASGALYAKCFTACMNGCGNMALVCLPICGAACTVTLPF